MKGYFITGTDTGVGKTFVSASITLALKGYYWKPVQSGVAEDLADKTIVQQMTGLEDQHFYPGSYELQAPLSPNQAAALENITIDIHNCKIPQGNYPLVVEGAGGIFAPLNKTHCIMDLMLHVGLPAVIVSRGTLGTINHTLLTVAALQQRNIPIKGIIFSGELNPANQTTIEEWSGVKTLFHLPAFKNLTSENFQKWVEQNRDKMIEALA